MKISHDVPSRNIPMQIANEVARMVRSNCEPPNFLGSCRSINSKLEYQYWVTYVSARKLGCQALLS